MPTTVATWNVNGIRSRHTQVIELVGQHQPDVVCLQELKPEQVPELVRNLPGYWCYWHGARAYSGVAARAARSCTVLREFGTSDHAPVVATFDAA
jgi:exodeoxyribonuclease-3